MVDQSFDLKVSLNDADLSGVDMRDADLSGSDLLGANLEGMRLDGADLSQAVYNVELCARRGWLCR